MLHPTHRPLLLKTFLVQADFKAELELNNPEHYQGDVEPVSLPYHTFPWQA